MTADPATPPPDASRDDPRRCAARARLRGDPLWATAPPARRLLLVEVGGAWGRSALLDSAVDRYHAGRLADRAQAAGVRVQLIRRPGRHAAVPSGSAQAWALVDVRPGREAVGWGSWHAPSQLLELDLTAPLVPCGRQDVALVCTHARHDVCCALRGRPVAAALAERTGWDVWECSHLGGDRFAANVLLLPRGDLFGGLDEESALGAVHAYRQGRIVRRHHRGRLGRPPVAQAAEHLAAVRLREPAVDGVQVGAITQVGQRSWDVAVSDAAGARYRLRVAARWSAPELLTCSAGGPSRVRQFRLRSWAAGSDAAESAAC